MKECITVLGIPLRTFIIVGGLFLFSTFLPTIIALILSWKEKNKKNE